MLILQGPVKFVVFTRLKPYGEFQLFIISYCHE